MEHVRIIELQEDECILAIYNPDDVYEYGLTSSSISQCISNGPNELMEFVSEMTEQHFLNEMDKDYEEYVPMALSFMNLPDDHVLPSMILIRQQSGLFMQYMMEHMIGHSQIERKAQQYISAYAKEFMNEKNSTVHAENTQSEPDLSKDHENSIHEFLFRFTDLNSAISACGFIPLEICMENSMIKYKNQYYLLFSCSHSDYEQVSKHSQEIIEFGNEEKTRSIKFIKEHGTLISGSLTKIVQSLIV